MKPILIYKLVPWTDAMLNEKSGIATTAEIINSHYGGGTYQCTVRKVTSGQREFYLIDKPI